MVYQPIITEFNESIARIVPLKSVTPEQMNKGIHLCRKTLFQLREKVRGGALRTESAEIFFFKTVKVVPLSWLIYFTEVGRCELRKPRTDTRLQKRFFKKQLHKAEKFFRKHRDFMYYMEQGYTYRDPEYFTRKSIEQWPLFPGTEGYRDPDFSTPRDLLWARVKGMERVVKHLQKAIRQISHVPLSNPNGSPQHHLEWTASKVSLTELIYALYSGKAFNHGQAEIGDITAAFETFFGVRLPQVYRTYASIKERKGRRARFLEELIFHLTQKIDREEAL